MRWLTSGFALVVVAVALAGVTTVPAPAAAPAHAPAITGAGGTFATVPSFRAIDAARTPGRATVHVPVLGQGGVPASGVSAVAVTLTVASTTRSGYLTAWADGSTRPITSNLNFVAGQDIANSAVVSVGGNGRIAVYNGAVGSVRVIVDVVGYYRSGAATSPGALTPTPPVRKLDTRIGQGGSPPGANGTVSVDVGVRNASVLVNLTVVGPQRGEHLTTYANGMSQPLTSTMNFVAGQTIANQAVVPVGPSGRIDIVNVSAGATDVLVDVVGTYQPGEPTAAGAFGAVSPTRVLDTRIAGSGGPIPNYSERTVAVGGHAGVPSTGVAAVIVNITVTHATLAYKGYLDAYAYSDGGGVGTRTSRMNYVAGQNIADLMTVPTAADGSIIIYAFFRTDVVVDVVGYVLDGAGASYGGIRGVVHAASTDDGTRALAGVHVSVYSGSDVVASATTDQYGDYVAVAPTSTVGDAVCFASSGYSGQCYPNRSWSSGHAPPAGSHLIPVRNAAFGIGDPGTASDGSVSVLLQPAGTGAITGTLSAADTHAPFSDASVEIYPASGDQSRPVEVTGVGSGGTYAALALPAGVQYVVCFSTPELQYQPVCYHDAAEATHGTPVGVTDGGYVTGIDQVLPGGGPTTLISGFITAAANGNPVTNTYVSLWDAAQTKTLESQYVSDNDGGYDLFGVPSGSYQVCVDGTFGRQGESAGTGYLSQCAPLTVSAPTTTAGPNFALTLGGLITGTIRSTDGHVLQVAHVTAYVGGVASRQIDSDSGGNYRLAGLPNGSYTVCVDGSDAYYDIDTATGPKGYRDQCWRAIAWNGSVPLPAGTTALAVTSGATKSGVGATLQKTP